MINFPNLKKFHTIVFDFDGIFTNNMVYVDQEGMESVKCDRSDSYGLNLLKNYLKNNNLDIDLFVLSTEKNNVVKFRCEKIKIKCFSGIDNKKLFLENYLRKKEDQNKYNFEGIIYLGNDLNDLEAMMECGFTICPNNAHPLIKEISNVTIERDGGAGFIRSFVEKILKIEFMEISQIISLLKR